jgi:hypothetical protein
VNAFEYFCRSTHQIIRKFLSHVFVDNEERYRAAHLKHNPNYPQFIVGDDIAILCIHVHEARICNIDDQVVKWALGDKPS